MTAADVAWLQRSEQTAWSPREEHAACPDTPDTHAHRKTATQLENPKQKVKFVFYKLKTQIWGGKWGKGT
jgi:hypothetical protein